MVKKLYLIFYDFGKQLQRDNIAAYASSAAFFFFLSMVPLLMVLFAMITYTPITEEDLVNLLLKLLPSALEETVVSLVNQIYDRSSAIIPVAVIVSLWSAGKAMMGLQMGLNVAHGVVETRNFFIKRLQACFYTVILLAAFIISFVMSLIGKNMLKRISSHLPVIDPFIEYFAKWRYVAVWLILMLVFAILYTYVPNVKLKLKMQLPGAFFASIAWVVLSFAFSIYVDNFNAFSTYGSLSSIIIIMMWLYSAMYILLIGANLNKYFAPIFKVFIRKNK